MAEATVSSQQPPKRRRWLRIVGSILIIFVVLIVALYFVGTSSAFFKGVILPKVSKSLNAEVTVSDASISPFSSVTLHNLQVRPVGQEPLVTASEVRARYSLMDIIRGRMDIEEVSLSAPTVVVIENPDGTRNVDPIVKGQQAEKETAKKETKPAQPAQPSKPVNLDLKKFALTDATVRYIKNYAGGHRDVMELSHVNVTAENLKNGQTGKLGLSADIKMDSNPPAPKTNGLLAAKLTGNFVLGLSTDLKPASIQGKTRLEVAQATGGMADLVALGAELDCEVNPTDIKQIALQFQKGGTRLGEVRVSGPFDMEKKEGHLTVQIHSIDKQVLNLAGGKNGMDFGTTTINSTNNLDLTKAGSVFGIKGELHVDKLQLIKDGQAIPAVDLLARYEITPTDIKQVSLQFQKNGASVGEVRVNGPFDMEKKQGHLSVQVLSLDKQVLNLAGAKSGLDFGNTRINSTNQVDLEKSGSLVKLLGQLTVNEFQVIRTNQATPPLDLVANYDETLDLDAKANLLKVFTITGTQRGNPLLKTELTSPMTVAWGNVNNSVGDSALNLTLTHLNLADWRPFTGEAAPVGDANVKLALLAQQQGKKLTFDLDARTENLTAGSGSNRITQATVIVQAHGEAADLKRVNLSNYKFQVNRQNGSLVSVAGSGTYDLEAQSADLQLSAQLALARLLQAVPQPGADLSSGTAELKAHIIQTADASKRTGGTNTPALSQNVTGSLSLTDLSGTFGKNVFRSFGANVDLDVGTTPQQVQVRKLSGKLNQGPNPGGAFDVTAQYQLSSKTAQFSAKFSDFNQNGLKPFLEPVLADKKLVSVALNGNASGQYDPKGDAAIKADVQLANLVVNDPSNQIPANPLEGKLQVDASLHNQVADVRLFQIGLTPTQRARNELQLKGQVDMSKTNAQGKQQFNGKLQLLADSLDLTSYYDLFVGPKKPEPTPVAPARGQGRPAPTVAASPTPTAPANEPEVIQLPFGTFTNEVRIGRFYLHDLEVTNIQAVTAINGSRVAMKPVQLAINGSPVNAAVQLNLGVPGYSYDLNFNATQVPLAPLVDTFQPERRGDLKGTITAQAQISGTGTSGASLQKTLTGQFAVDTTNLDLAIPKLRSKLMKVIINVIGTVPTLVKNPAAGVGSLVGGVLGGETGSGGWATELQQSPIEVIQARGSIGSGTVDLQRAYVESPAFEVETHGPIKLAEILTNSTLGNLPLGISVRRGLAEKINFVPAGTPSNAAFAKLPDFASIGGTIGAPDPKINKTALLGTALQQLGGNIPGVSKQTGGLIQGSGGLLTGQQSGAKGTNAPTTGTNQPPAQSPVNSLLDQFLKPKKK